MLLSSLYPSLGTNVSDGKRWGTQVRERNHKLGSMQTNQSQTHSFLSLSLPFLSRLIPREEAECVMFHEGVPLLSLRRTVMDYPFSYWNIVKEEDTRTIFTTHTFTYKHIQSPSLVSTYLLLLYPKRYKENEIFHSTFSSSFLFRQPSSIFSFMSDRLVWLVLVDIRGKEVRWKPCIFFSPSPVSSPPASSYPP